jgi:hypothetical protein
MLKPNFKADNRNSSLIADSNTVAASDAASHISAR